MPTLQASRSSGQSSTFPHSHTLGKSNQLFLQKPTSHHGLLPPLLLILSQLQWASLTALTLSPSIHLPPLPSIEPKGSKKKAKGFSYNPISKRLPSDPSLAQSDCLSKKKPKASQVPESLEDLSELTSYYYPSLGLPKDLKSSSSVDATPSLAVAHHRATPPFPQ